MTKEDKKAAHKIVMKHTLYGDPKAVLGSSSRSRYESELKCVLAGMEYQINKNKNKNKKLCTDEEFLL